LKKIDKLVLLDFIPPYLLAFFVAEFVLVMQFLWKYIDDIIGKGFSLGVLLEMIFYFSVRIIPEAVPVSILIASVMVFGDLADKYEISAMKSSGISLIRIMAMGILISILTACFSLLASNYLKPRANYKFIYRFNAIRKQKPALNIAEGTFSKDFRNFVIRVGDKEESTGEIRDVLVYDHTVPDRRKVNMLVASKGRMYASPDDDYFVMELEDGEQYREIDKAKKTLDDNSEPFMRTEFKKWTKVFDMSEFDLEASSLNLHRKEYDLLNASQLRTAIDSIDKALIKNSKRFEYNYSELVNREPAPESKVSTKEDEDDKYLPAQMRDAIKKSGEQEKYITKTKNPAYMDFDREAEQDISGLTSLLESFNRKDRIYLAKAIKYEAEKRQDRLSSAFREEQSIQYGKARYVLRLHQQYSWALICIIFIFIGAPLGSIVKKGGYGYPLLVAIIFFMLFIILNIMGERLSKTMAIGPVFAAWLPNIVIAPLAVFLSYRAMNDSNFQDIRDFFIRLLHRFRKSEA